MITVVVMLEDVSLALSWQDWSISKPIGQPDTLTVELTELTDALATLLGPMDNFYYTHLYRDAAILFSGVATKIRRRNTHGRVTYFLDAVGWEYLAPRRLVGVPDGSQFLIQEDDDPDRLPVAVAVDPSATDLQPTAASVQALFAAYWNAPLIDTDTYVTDILEVGAPVEELSFSGSDIDGVMGTLIAAGNAAAMWWIANDSPDPQSSVAPNLALHFGLVVLPDDGDPVTSGLEAPYVISDSPNWTTSIMASVSPELDGDQTQRVDAVYVRGATGYTEPVVASGSGYVPGAVVVEGGSGWVGTPGGLWGDAYVDAPAAISPTQRDAFGNAHLAVHGGPAYSGTILIEGDWHGWDKGQAVMVTDAGLGLSEHWFLIRSVAISPKDPMGAAMSYSLNVGDVLTPQLGYVLRQQRLQEQRKEIRPATKFIPYVGDLQLDPSETAPLTMQLANDAGRAMAVKGVNATWHLLINGVDATDPEDTGNLFWLTVPLVTTDELGQITATLNAGAITGADACKPWAEIAA